MGGGRNEFELAPFCRQFSIPEGLDHGNAVADFSNGILTLRISNGMQPIFERPLDFWKFHGTLSR